VKSDCANANATAAVHTIMWRLQVHVLYSGPKPLTSTGPTSTGTTQTFDNPRQISPRVVVDMIANVEPPVSHDVVITTNYAKTVLTSHPASMTLASDSTSYNLDIPHPNSPRVVIDIFHNLEHPTLHEEVTTTCHSKIVLTSPRHYFRLQPTSTYPIHFLQAFACSGIGSWVRSEPTIAA